MKRRLFIQSSSLALSTTGLAACGGGEGAADEAQLLQSQIEEGEAGLLPQSANGGRKIPRPPAPAPAPAPAPVPAPAPAPDAYPAWVEGRAYAAGAIVRYTDGKLYIAKFANPGYTPTISTYYWAPYVASTPAPAPTGYPNWVEGQAYAAGAIVRYTDGNLYIAKFANPGYIPTVSTYYWAPYGVVAAPSPSPAPAPAPAAADGLPAKILGCYFTAWNTAFPITSVPLDFNLIYLFHAVPVGNGAFRFDYGYNVSAAQVQTCRNRGQKVILSVGGAGNGFYFSTRAQSQAFVDSFRSMASALGGVDGCDFNNFEAEIGANAPEMIWISQQLRAIFGANFAITSPPAPWSAQDKTFLQRMSNAGVLTYAGPQYYDSPAFNSAGYISNSINEWVGLLGDARKVVVGLGGSYSNGPSLADCIREWDIIEARHPSIRGMFCWSAQTNQSAGNVWGSTMRARLV